MASSEKGARRVAKKAAGAADAPADAGTAARILAAAEALLAERGYDGVSMREVAERAGVNKALIFYYYRSKESLFDAVLDRYYGAHAAALEVARSAGGTVRERVHRMLDAYVDFMDAHEAYPRLVQLEILRGGPHLPRIRENLGRLYEWVAHTLGGLVSQSGPTSARQLALSISGLVVNYYTYAPALGAAWRGADPLGKAARAERRAHLHWVLDAILDRLLAQDAPAEDR